MSTVIGFGVAIVLMVGYFKKNGDLQFNQSEITSTYGFAEANVNAGNDYAKEETKHLLNADRSGDYDGRDYKNPDAYSSAPAQPKATRAVRSTSNMDEWVDEFSAVAVSQAVSRGVPAALSLAVGLKYLDQGARILSWSDFVEKVVDPLASAKQRASSDIRSNYFKYSANSDLWVTGLDVLGKHSEKELQAVIRRYQLKDYDKKVRLAVINGTPVDELTAKKAEYVAEEVTTFNRQEKRNTPRIEKVAIGGNAADQVREMEEEAYYDELVSREVAREIAKQKIKSGKYIDESDMDQLIMETNRETEQVVENKLTFMGRKINKKHPEAEKMLDITRRENAAAREELFQKKLRENKLDSRSRRKLKD